MALGLPRIWDEYFPGGGGGFDTGGQWPGYNPGNENPGGGGGEIPVDVPPVAAVVTPTGSVALVPVASLPVESVPSVPVPGSFLDRVASSINANPLVWGLGGIGAFVLVLIFGSQSK